MLNEGERQGIRRPPHVEFASGSRLVKSTSLEVQTVPGDSGRMALTSPKFCSPSAWSALYGGMLKKDMKWHPRPADLHISKRDRGQWAGHYYVSINMSTILNWTCDIYDHMPHVTITYHVLWLWPLMHEFTIDGGALLNALQK